MNCFKELMSLPTKAGFTGCQVMTKGQVAGALKISQAKY
jgi:hypothetical protein